MKFLLSVGIITIAGSLLVFADNESKVKIISDIPLKISHEYFGRPFILGLAVDTYNKITTDAILLKDWPKDTKWRAEVSRSPKFNSKCKKYQKIDEYTISLCSHTNDKNDELLADFFLEAKKAGKCVTKGHVFFNETDGLKFYNLLTEKQLTRECFEIVNHFMAGNSDFYTDVMTYATNDE